MKPTKPRWIAQLPSTVFPRGPRAFYCWLCAFKSGTCFLFNYRLAEKFGVSVRTIRRWRTWLRDHQLLHTWWLDKNHPRINCHHYRTFNAWLAAMALPKKRKKAFQPRLSPAEKRARVRAFRKALFFKGGGTKLSS